MCKGIIVHKLLMSNYTILGVKYSWVNLHKISIKHALDSLCYVSAVLLKKSWPFHILIFLL